jgi:hypothetical protein
VFLLWFPQISSHYQTARQTQNRRAFLTHFAAGLHLSSHFYILSHSTVLPSCSLNLRDKVSLQKRWLLGCLIGRWSISPSASWCWSEFEPRFLPAWWAVLPFPHCFLHLTGFHCALRPSSRFTGRMNPPPGQAVHWCLVGSPPGGPGGHTPVTREVITHHLCNPRWWSPKTCCRSLLAEIQDFWGN